MALVPIQHSPADKGTLIYPVARQSILVQLVYDGTWSHSCWDVGGVDTESDPCWGVGSPSLMYCFT